MPRCKRGKSLINVMDTTRFRIKLQPDFVKILFELGRPTNKKGVSNRLTNIVRLNENKRQGFDILDESPGGVGSLFSFNVQNVKNPAQLQSVFDGLEREYGKSHGFAVKPHLAGWEVSLDAIPLKGKKVTRREVAEMVAHLFLTVSYRFPDGYSIRIYHEKHGEAFPATFAALVGKIEQGWCLAVGNQRHDPKKGILATPYSMRGYLKETDEGEAFNEGEFFARLEFFIQGEAFSFSQPADLNDFDFHKWNRENGFFNFRTLDTDKLSPFVAQLLNERARPQALAKDPNNKRRKTPKNTKTNEPLNRKIRNAANALSHEWAKAPACKKPTTFENQNPENMGVCGAVTETYNNSSPSYSSYTSSPVTGSPSSYPSPDTRESMGSDSDPCLSRPLPSLSLSVSSTSSRVFLPRLGLKGSVSDPFPIGGAITSTGTTRGALATRDRALTSSRNVSRLKNNPSKPYIFRIQRSMSSSMFVVSNLANISTLDKLHAAKVIELNSSQPP